jgi:HlyD family secretion protein
VASARRSSSALAGSDLPVARVKRGDLVLKAHTTGELRATHISMLAAPAIGGGNLKITRLLRAGAVVKSGDVVLEFDPSEQQYKIEQNRSELLQAEQEIAKAQAEDEVQKAQDKVALLKAKYDVRRAELEVGKNELVSSIDARKNELALEQAKRVLSQLEEDIHSHIASGKAGIMLSQEKRHKAQLAMKQAQDSLEKMRVRSTINGLVKIEKNQPDGFFFRGMVVPDFHEGDQAQPGTPIASVVDNGEIELAAKVSEREGGSVRVGQPVEIEFDALPGLIFQGSVKTVGGVVGRNIFNGGEGGGIEMTMQLPHLDARLRPGLTAQVSIVGDTEKNVLYVPRQALFDKDGKTIAYVRSGGEFESREVKIRYQNESRAAVDGLGEGVAVALVDPFAHKKAGASSAGSPSGPGGTL